MKYLKSFGSSIAIAALFLTAGQLAGYGNPGGGQALAAAPQAKQKLTNIIQLLKVADSLYAAGNAAGAQAKYKQAKSGWKNAAPAISKSEAREIQQLLDTLGKQLNKEAAAANVKSTISDLLDELHENIESLGK